jgi:EmrB/QacA subfamily drug resistance transporter
MLPPMARTSDHVTHGASVDSGVGAGHGDGAVHPNIILAVLSLAGLAYAVLSSAVIPALPTFQHQLHTSETGATWLLTSFLLSASVGTAIIGRLGDIYGKERLLLWTLLILAAGTLLAAVSGSLTMLIVARVLQGVAGGIFPLAFSIARDEFPAERVAGSIGLMSSILGVGGGAGLVIGALIVQHLGWHWLFWIPLVVTLAAAAATRKYVPESPVRSPGRVNWGSAVLMSIGLSALLVAVAQTTVWGWGSAKTIITGTIGIVFIVLWITFEVRSSDPLVDMTMMRVRGVWTTNLAAFMLGAGMYSSFIVFPQFAQLPKSTGFGFGASVVVSSLYLLPSALGMSMLGSLAGRVARRWGSKLALIVGTLVGAVAFGFAAVAHSHPYDLLITSTLFGIGIGLAFSALGNLIVQAVPPTQTGVASGMNTVMRTLGGALGGQLSATFIVNNVAHGLPTVTGFTDTYWMATVFLIVCAGAGALVPTLRAARSGQDEGAGDFERLPAGTRARTAEAA